MSCFFIFSESYYRASREPMTRLFATSTLRRLYATQTAVTLDILFVCLLSTQTGCIFSTNKMYVLFDVQKKANNGCMEREKRS